MSARSVRLDAFRDALALIVAAEAGDEDGWAAIIANTDQTQLIGALVSLSLMMVHNLQGIESPAGYLAGFQAVVDQVIPE